MIKVTFSAAASLLALVLAGCATGRSSVEHALTFENSPRHIEMDEAWSEKLPGVVTDLAVARASGSALVATVPDYDAEHAPRHYMISFFWADGKCAWSNKMESQVKSEAISDDGQLIAVASYDDQLRAFDVAGNSLWSTEAPCRPVFLNQKKKILCYHDDDAEPEVAFDLYSYAGKKLSSYPIQNDILALKLSRDESFVAMGFTRGQIVLLDKDLHASWQRRVPGEILDLSVSSGSSPRLAVLFQTKKKGEKVSVFDSEGRLLADSPLPQHLEELEISPDGKGIFGYGNGPKGQVLYQFAITGPKLVIRWHNEDPRYADFSSSMIVTRDQAIIGFEDSTPGTRHSHVVSFDYDGKLLWNVPLVTEEGAYLYADSYSEKNRALVVATDDGVLSSFKPKK